MDAIQGFFSTFTTGFSILVIWLAPPVIWAIVVVVFPKFFGDALLKAVEHRHATRLEEIKATLAHENNNKIEILKADIGARYSTLHSSINLLSASQSEMYKRRLVAIEKIWSVVLQMNQQFGGLTFLDTILLPNELDDYFKGTKMQSSQYLDSVIKPYMRDDSVFNKWNACGTEEIERERPFVGEQIWKIFYVLRAVYARYAMLIHTSLKKKQYQNWKNDTHLFTILHTVLSDKVTESAKNMPLQGLQMIILHLTEAFLKEAEYILSGIRTAASVLPDLQAILLTERDKITAGIQQDKP